MEVIPHPAVGGHLPAAPINSGLDGADDAFQAVQFDVSRQLAETGRLHFYRHQGLRVESLGSPHGKYPDIGPKIDNGAEMIRRPLLPGLVTQVVTNFVDSIQIGRAGLDQKSGPIILDRERFAVEEEFEQIFLQAVGVSDVFAVKRQDLQHSGEVPPVK